MAHPLSGMDNSGRRYQRYRVSLPVLVTSAKGQTAFETEDVSLNGLFIRTQTPVPLRRLLRLEVRLPPTDEAITLHAMAAHVLGAEDDWQRTKGLGLSLYGNDRYALERWGRFIQHLREEQSDATNRVLLAHSVARPAPEPLRRRYDKIAAVLEVRPDTVDELHALHAQNVCRGGMFLVSAEPRGVGEELVVDVVHPVTAAAFSLVCVVWRQVRGRESGMSVELLDMDGARREEWWEFVAAGMQLPRDSKVDIAEL